MAQPSEAQRLLSLLSDSPPYTQPVSPQHISADKKDEHTNGYINEDIMNHLNTTEQTTNARNSIEADENHKTHITDTYQNYEHMIPEDTIQPYQTHSNRDTPNSKRDGEALEDDYTTCTTHNGNIVVTSTINAGYLTQEQSVPQTVKKPYIIPDSPFSGQKLPGGQGQSAFIEKLRAANQTLQQEQTQPTFLQRLEQAEKSELHQSEATDNEGMYPASSINGSQDHKLVQHSEAEHYNDSDISTTLNTSLRKLGLPSSVIDLPLHQKESTSQSFYNLDELQTPQLAQSEEDLHSASGQVLADSLFGPSLVDAAAYRPQGDPLILDEKASEVYNAERTGNLQLPPTGVDESTLQYAQTDNYHNTNPQVEIPNLLSDSTSDHHSKRTYQELQADNSVMDDNYADSFNARQRSRTTSPVLEDEYLNMDLRDQQQSYHEAEESEILLPQTTTEYIPSDPMEDDRASWGMSLRYENMHSSMQDSILINLDRPVSRHHDPSTYLASPEQPDSPTNNFISAFGALTVQEDTNKAHAAEVRLNALTKYITHLENQLHVDGEHIAELEQYINEDERKQEEQINEQRKLKEAYHELYTASKEAGDRWRQERTNLHYQVEDLNSIIRSQKIQFEAEKEVQAQQCDALQKQVRELNSNRSPSQNENIQNLLDHIHDLEYSGAENRRQLESQNTELSTRCISLAEKVNLLSEQIIDLENSRAQILDELQQEQEIKTRNLQAEESQARHLARENQDLKNEIAHLQSELNIMRPLLQDMTRIKERTASSLYERATSVNGESPYPSRPGSAHLAYPTNQGGVRRLSEFNGGFTPPPDRWAVHVPAEDHYTIHEHSQRLNSDLLALEAERQTLKTNLSRGGSGVNARKNREASEAKLDSIEKAIGRLRREMKEKGML